MEYDGKEREYFEEEEEVFRTFIEFH